MIEIAGTPSGNLASILVLLAVVGARPLGFVMLHPIFGRFGISSGVLRGSIVVAMSAPIMPAAIAQMLADPGVIAPLRALRLVGTELFIGILLGLISGVPFWAASAAGDYIDNQRGASMANLIDPQSSGETSVTGTLLFQTCILILAAEGVLFPTVFGPLMESYALFPVMAGFPPPDAGQAGLVLQLLDQITRAGIILALPVVIPLLLTEIIVAIATKYTQQMNAMFLSMSIKQAVTALLMLVYTVILAGYAVSQIGQGAFSVETLPGFLRGAGDGQ